MNSKRETAAATGIFSGISAYLIWGISPIYWKAIQTVPAIQIMLHRIVWSFLLLILFILITKKWQELRAISKTPKRMLVLTGTSLIISTNWFVYIWAVNNGYIIQASLGYYINPLVNVFLGMVFLRERLRRLQILAVGLAALGVVYLTIFYQSFPWISLFLAFSFGFYALIRKVAAISSLGGLTMETLLLSIPAFGWLCYLNLKGVGSFGNEGVFTDVMLAGAGLITAIPLLLFNIAGKRLLLATLGFLQYLAPTCMFLIGVVLWGEKIAGAQLISFGLIWTALVLYSLDSLKTYRWKH